ncbi:MAG: metal-sensitive transcriptional regulator [Gemmatimonadaceae bacterium]|nr:metal-sensitive transcriptional regulator [Gemmatimonadaceae bacterium]
MDYEVKDGHLTLRRTREEREPLLKRLARVEGQVRGLTQMVEADRHCLDAVQQINAISSALRELALLMISEHLEAALDAAAKTRDGHELMQEMITVLRAAMRQASSGPGS